uniref:DUF4773 domain-containing protein n=1 Tax=Ditylenchus dipsaci TaxID=166011 RepID=A0A915CX14_9BILA
MQWTKKVVVKVTEKKREAERASLATKWLEFSFFSCDQCIGLPLPFSSHPNNKQTHTTAATLKFADLSASENFFDPLLFSNEVRLTVRNPPPVCFEVPHLRDFASLCLRLYNVVVTEESISGCTKLEAVLYHLKVATAKLGCFKIPV